MERLKSQKVEPPQEVVGEYCEVFKKINVSKVVYR